MGKFLALMAFLAGTASATGSEAESPYVENPNALSCSPGVLEQGDILTLRFHAGMAQELAVRRVADETWFFLVVGAPPENMPQLMTPSGLSRASEVSLITSQEWIPWELGKSSEKIVKFSGPYQIYLSENLESEIGGYSCTVEYRDEP